MDAGGRHGAWVIRASWASTAVFAVTALGDWAGITAFEAPALLVAISFFGGGLVVWAVAFGIAVVRSARHHITLSGLFFLSGTAPQAVRVKLLGSLGAAVAVAALTASAAPFGVMEPVLPMALTGLWGARYGEFPSRSGVAPDRGRGS